MARTKQTCRRYTPYHTASFLCGMLRLRNLGVPIIPPDPQDSPQPTNAVCTMRLIWHQGHPGPGQLRQLAALSKRVEENPGCQVHIRSDTLRASYIFIVMP